jgi:hypothetical protein
MATEYVAEFEALRDGLQFRPQSLDLLGVVNRKKGGAAWVRTFSNAFTGVVTRMEMQVNARYLGTRAKARASWLDGRDSVAKGEAPFSAVGHWGEEAAIRAAVRHEYGHVVDNHLLGLRASMADDGAMAQGIHSLFRRRLKKVTPEEIAKMSKYANANPQETLAESFCLAVSGKWELIPKPLHQPLRLFLSSKD